MKERTRKKQRATGDPESAPTDQSIRRWRWVVVILALLSLTAFAALVRWNARTSSLTYDELSHIAAGTSYVTTADYRLNPEHPPLAKALAGWAVKGLRVTPDRFDRDATSRDPVRLQELSKRWKLALVDDDAQWQIGQYFLFGVSDAGLQRYGAAHAWELRTDRAIPRSLFPNDADRIIATARGPIVLFGLTLAILVFFWARELSGWYGALLATALVCFDPNLIAHSALVTTDVAASATIFGAIYFFWRTTRTISIGNVAGWIAFTGLAFVAKFSAALLAPMFVLLGCVRIMQSQPWPLHVVRRRMISSLSGRAAAAAVLGIACAAAAVAIIWGSYRFRYDAVRDVALQVPAEKAAVSASSPAGLRLRDREPGHFPLRWILRRTIASRKLSNVWPDVPPDEAIDREASGMPLGAVETVIDTLNTRHMLPEAYLYGFALARMNLLYRTSYLRGELANRGFPEYFFWCFALKTALPALVILLVASWSIFIRGIGRTAAVAFLLLPVAVYLIVSVNSTVNIGVRHILPIYPFLYVFAGSWIRDRRAIFSPLRAVALAAIVLSSFAVFAPPYRPAWIGPHHLAYFNELAGGPRAGDASLLDSNMDWGQDLGELSKWLRARLPPGPVYLSYFGTADPRYYGVEAINLEGGYSFAPQTPMSGVAGGTLAVSATNEHGVFMTPAQRGQMAALLRRAERIGEAGYSIRIYRLR